MADKRVDLTLLDRTVDRFVSDENCFGEADCWSFLRWIFGYIKTFFILKMIIWEENEEKFLSSKSVKLLDGESGKTNSSAWSFISGLIIFTSSLFAVFSLSIWSLIWKETVSFSRSSLEDSILRSFLFSGGCSWSFEISASRISFKMKGSSVKRFSIIID